MTLWNIKWTDVKDLINSLINKGTNKNAMIISQNILEASDGEGGRRGRDGEHM